MSHVRVGRSDTILDVGCGGGRTVQKLSAIAADGHVDGLDYSSYSEITVDDKGSWLCAVATRPVTSD
jgi:ubiquinone/menaquinone biosynthesis C-methylase UbiE